MELCNHPDNSTPQNTKNATMSQNIPFPVILHKNKNGQSQRESNKRHFGDAGKQSFCCVLAIWALRSESAPCVLRSQHSEHSPGRGLVLRPAFCVLAAFSLHWAGAGAGATRRRVTVNGMMAQALHRAEPSGADSVQLFVFFVRPIPGAPRSAPLGSARLGEGPAPSSRLR